MKYNGVFYEIFIPSYSDGNGDGLGDFYGIINRLDYLESIGIKGIWLTPIHPATSKHHYDVEDYFAVDPVYGDLKIFEELLVEAHRREIKVIIDLVINHSSHKHPWFEKESHQKDLSQNDLYIWRHRHEIQSVYKNNLQFDSINKIQWHFNELRDAYYYGYFDSTMPEFNYNNEELRKLMIEVAQFWLKLGVDGFRLDAAKHIFEHEENLAKSANWWKEFRATLEGDYPELVLIGEVWDGVDVQRQFVEGIHGLLNFELRDYLLSAVQNEQQSFFEVFLKNYRQLNKECRLYTNASFLGNHDVVRVSSILPAEKVNLAFAILLLLPGTPIIYYGDEIGMFGEKPDEKIRTPMPWGDDKEKIIPYGECEQQDDGCNVKSQLQSENSLLNYIIRLLKLRNMIPSKVLDLRLVAEVPVKVLFYRVLCMNKVFYVLHNLGGDREVFKTTHRFERMELLFHEGSESGVVEGAVSLAAYGSAVFCESVDIKK